MDCKDLGLGFGNKSPPAPPPSLSDDRSNQGMTVSINYHMHSDLFNNFPNFNVKPTIIIEY